MDVQDSDIAWQQTLRLLCSINEFSASRHYTSPPRAGCKVKARRGRPLGSKLKVVEELTSESARTWHASAVTNIEIRSDKTIAVSWADATSGHYCEQLWAIGIARKGAVCALTGDSIRRGDPVYRPRSTTSHVPSNAEAMILLTSLKRAYSEHTVPSDTYGAIIRFERSS